MLQILVVKMALYNCVNGGELQAVVIEQWPLKGRTIRCSCCSRWAVRGSKDTLCCFRLSAVETCSRAPDQSQPGKPQNVDFDRAAA